jgi:ABC-type nitrate/sulfonate/bicarbonate transport system permease component
VSITGSMIPGALPAPGASQVVQVVTVDSVGRRCGPLSGAVWQGGGTSTQAIVGGIIVAAVAGVAVGIYESQQSKSPASP